MSRKRKAIADRGTYQRIFIGKSLRAHKGTRWTKPKAILQGVESRIVAETAKGKVDNARVANLRVLHALAKSFLDRYGNKGHVYLEYAWDMFVKHGKCLDEQDLMVAVNNGSINRWHQGLHSSGRKDGEIKSEIVFSTNNPARLRAQIEAAKTALKVDPAKVVGDRIRAEAMAARKRQAEFAAQYKAEQALLEGLRAKLKGA